MNTNELITLLNTLKRYDPDFRHDGMEECKGGDYIKVEDLAKVLGLKMIFWTDLFGKE